jgi:hypothetical protein
MLYTYLDNETQLWCVGCKIWRGGSWGNNEYKILESNLPTKEMANVEMNKYKYDLLKNDYKKEV